MSKLVGVAFMETDPCIQEENQPSEVRRNKDNEINYPVSLYHMEQAAE
jgi:hypothetical protein